MTTYAHHPSASSIVATWPTGAGSVAHRVTRVPSTGDDALIRHLAQGLDLLSDRLWTDYSSATTDRPDPVRFAAIVRRPNMPVGNLLRRADDDRDEAAHHVGRLLAEVDDRGMRESVIREIDEECAAVCSAVDGDLTGRAQQAVTRLRGQLATGRLAAAHEIMHDVPMGSERLFTEVEPLAAAIAAAEWLGAAIVVTAPLVGLTSAVRTLACAQLVADQDLRIAMAAFLHPGPTAEDTVRALLRQGALAATGSFVIAEEEFEDPLEACDADEEDRIVTTVLDPISPGRSLVEGLIAGIQGCFEVYLEEITRREQLDPDPRLTGPHWHEEVRQRFDAELRRTAVVPQA